MGAKTLFTVNLGENGGRKYFYSIKRIKEWINKEIKYWNWIRSASIAGKNNLIQKHLQPIELLKNEVSGLDKENDSFEESLNRVENLINKYYGQNEILHSSHPKAKYVQKIKKESKERAAYTLFQFYGININSNHSDHVIGLLYGFLYDRDIKSFNESNREVINELEISLKEHVEEFHKVINEKESALDSLADTKRDSLNKREEEFDSFIENAEKEINKIEQVYDKRLALQASVRYWKTKAESHEDFAREYRNYFAWSLVITSILLTLEIYYLLNNYGINNAPPYWITAIVILTGAVCVWVARILAKIFLSNIHLKTEAEERRVMILTFLSLLRREEAISDDDKRVILQTLFRPSATGILKEDKLPSAFWDQLTKQ
ncbi:MAG: DUF2975 domain-containing protein [Balneolaceae bacterium]|nr:DUF2975 domain-containing protein [Balneolaceae bacterium]